MSEIQRLLRVAQRRNEASEYTELKFRILRTLRSQLADRLKEDRMSKSVFLEAIVRGYIDRHPSVLAMIDQWVRDNISEGREPKAPALKKRDLDEIYAAIQGGMMFEED